MPITTIILAGGQGKRMASNTQKVLHRLCGLPMLEWVLNAAEIQENKEPPITVLGHMGEQVKEYYGDRLRYVEDAYPLGSGSALMEARELIKNETGRVLILAGDLPLLTRKTIERLCALQHEAVFLTATLNDPAGYGRVMRYSEGNILGVIEEENLQEVQRSIKEVRVSAYCFDTQALIRILDKIEKISGNKEFGMSAILDTFIQNGSAVETIAVTAEEAMGVNDRVQLAACAKVLQERINKKHMQNGVTLIDPQNTYIDATVKLGRDCIIYPGVILQGNTVIEEGCTLYPSCRIVDSHFGKFVEAQGVVAFDAVVGNAVKMGPYVHLRPGTRLGDYVKVGNYIEVKNSVVGEGSKLPHLSYIGDGDVGKHVNLGCGTVFVNYDGYKKHRTKIGDNAFIGCNTSLVAPVSVGAGSFTAAGSVITEDVPEETLAVARARQVNKIGYMSKLRVKRGEKS